MRTTMLLFLASVIVSACNNDKTRTQAATENNNVIAEDTLPVKKGVTDDTDCMLSKGEQWSMIRKACLKLVDADIRLEPKHSSLDQLKPAYLLFSEDKLRVEIFLPTQKKSVVIRKSTETSDDKWLNGPLTVTQTDDTFALYDEGKLLYQGVRKD